MNQRDKQELLSSLDGQSERAFHLQSAFTSMQALGPGNNGKGEQAKADYIEDWLRLHGINHIEHLDAPDDRVPSGKRPNLIARIPGRTAQTLWILGHMDVVPAGDISVWKTDPWTVTRDISDADIIYGRGVEDNQQAMVSMCLVAASIMELGIMPDLSLGLIFVSDEETGNAYGIKHVLRERPGLVAPGDLVIVPDSGSPDGAFIQVAEKGILWLRIDIAGRQCHASRPDDGVNALTAASAMILSVSEIEKQFSKKNMLFDPPRSTFTPTKHELNVPNVNTMSGHEVFYVDCRVLPSYCFDEVISAFRSKARQIEKLYGVQILVEQAMQEPAALPTSEDSPVITALKQAIKEVLGVECHCGGIGGSTVACCFREKGIPSAVWSRIFENCHAPNEAARLSYAVGDAKVFACILFNNGKDA